MDIVVGLPYDLLLDTLGRLPNRALAESRQVCRAWRAAVDDSGLLPARFHRVFPPHAFPGVFTNNIKCMDGSYFFRAPASRSVEPQQRGASRDGDDDLVFRCPRFQHDWFNVLDHCNGLLLLCCQRQLYCVCNPATVRCAHLPLPPKRKPWDSRLFLAFDPAVSRHHTVFLLSETMPQLHREIGIAPRVETQQPRDEIYLEQPHTRNLFEEGQGKDRQHGNELAVKEPRDRVLSLLVFLSQNNQWGSRELRPRRCAPEHLFDELTSRCAIFEERWKSAEYWQGSLYVHCRKNILMILRTSEEAYDLIQLPGMKEYTRMFELPTRSVLASYEKGIRYVAIDIFQLKVWAIQEAVDGELGWALTHEANLGPYGHQIEHSLLPTQSMVPWKLVERIEETTSLLFYLNPRRYHIEEHGDDEGESRQDPDYSWNSDEDNFIDMDESTVQLISPPENVSCGIIGLHPHKDVLLLHIKDNVVAYHLNSSRMQYLAERLFERVDPYSCVDHAFPYRPCYVDGLRQGNLSCRILKRVVTYTVSGL